jgi:predicted Holliday junction resolvase-like endonuclease
MKVREDSMMGWVIAILFGSAIVLLILSFFKTTQSKSQLEQQIEHSSISLMNEVHELQKQIRTIELDAEITAKQSGAMEQTSQERIMLREVLDMQKRGYSTDSIAAKTGLKTYEVEEMLAPYMARKIERSMAVQ